MKRQPENFPMPPTRRALTPEKSFVPVAGMGKSPLLLVTRQTFGVGNVKALVTLAKKDPAKPLTMGSASSGNITHLAGEYAANLRLHRCPEGLRRPAGSERRRDRGAPPS